MSRPRSPHPKLVHDRARGQAACWYTDPHTGKRRGVRLGPWGSAEAESAYACLLADLRVGAVEPPAAVGGASVAELCVRYARHASQYYGGRSSEFAHLKAVLAILAGRCGELPAGSFGPKEFRRCRDEFAGKGWQRQYVNDQARRLRTVFKWAVGEELVPAGVWQSLRAVPGLARGRSPAPEREPVTPPPLRAVVAVLRRVPPTVAAMIRFQWLTGCRCQDVCGLRWEYVDRSGDVWVCRPEQHKGRWRGRVREFFAGPRAQRVMVRPDPVASGPEEPGENASCTSRKPGSDHPASGPVFRTRLGGNYKVMSYCRAVLRACRRAGVEEWSPGQLRHATGTRVRARYGLEAAQVILGHAKADVTQLYAETSRTLAKEVARKAG